MAGPTPVAPNPLTRNPQVSLDLRGLGRQRNSTAACFECRKRKQRCIGGDSNTPCNLCVKNGIQCKIDLTTDGRRKWHSKLKEVKSQQQLLERLLSTIRSNPQSQVDALLGIIRRGGPIEEIQAFIDSHAPEEEVTSQTSYNSTLETSHVFPLEDTPDEADAREDAESTIQEQRNLLELIGASGCLPAPLAAKVDKLLSQRPYSTDSLSSTPLDTPEAMRETDMLDAPGGSGTAQRSLPSTEHHSFPNLPHRSSQPPTPDLRMGGHQRETQSHSEPNARLPSLTSSFPGDINDNAKLAPLRQDTGSEGHPYSSLPAFLQPPVQSSSDNITANFFQNRKSSTG